MKIQFCEKCGTLLRGKKCVGCGSEITKDQWEQMKSRRMTSQQPQPTILNITKTLPKPKKKVVVKKKRSIIRRIEKRKK